MAILHGMRMRWLALPLLVAGPAALAQVSPEFARILASPAEQQMVVTGARQAAVIAQNPCGDGMFKVTDKVAIIQAPVFREDGTLRTGEWKQVVDYTGCGRKLALNVQVKVPEGKGAAIASLVPGTTHAEAALQADVFRSEAMKLAVNRWREPSCNTVYAADTVFEAREPAPPGGASPAWRETWTIAACERRGRVSILFTPGAKGTSFAISIPKDGADTPRPAPARP
jgi:hypothetical protein